METFSLKRDGKRISIRVDLPWMTFRAAIDPARIPRGEDFRKFAKIVNEVLFALEFSLNPPASRDAPAWSSGNPPGQA